MTDGDWGGSGLKSADRTERDQAAVGGAQIDGAEPVRALPKLRLHLHDNMVLIERSEHGRDLALAERVVEGVVDHLRREAEARSGGAVVDEGSLEAVVLLIAV